MGWFSKAIPERKWIEVSATLASNLKNERESWYSIFRRETSSRGFTLPPDGLSRTATHYISLLQLQAVASTVQDNGYVSDVTFFLELVYGLLTGNRPAEFHRNLEATPFCLAGDAAASLTLWGQSMASELSSDTDRSELIEELARYGAFLVSRTMFATCVACGDKKGAEKIRSFFVGN
jgi:hypothetical protein